MAGQGDVHGEHASNAPPDADTVRVALRLGWYLAELRGRYWWQGPRPSSAVLPVDPPFALPLRPERTPAEAREQACETVVETSRRLEVADPPEAARSAGGPFPERLAAVIAPLEADGAQLLSPGDDVGDDTAKRDAAWGHLAALLHEWDSAIQDRFSARADALANAYLLGRGLAECYWALGPDRPAAGSVQEGRTAASAWAFLFGEDRRRELSRLVARVAPTVDPLTPAALAGSIEAWGEVAAEEDWRRADVGRARLYEQLRRWYELLVLGRDPTTYVKPYAVLRGWRTTLRAVRPFWPQLLLALVSVVAVGALAWFLGTDRGTAALKVLLGLGGVLGLTAATVAGKAKSAGQRLLARLRQDAYSDLVAIAVTSVPDLPAGAGRRWGPTTTDRRLREAVSQRRLTPATPLCDTRVAPRS
jgi:hypothetical protein